MAKIIDLTNQTFGKLTVTGRFPPEKGDREARWECVCECGNTTVVRGTHLRQGKVVSCGCHGKNQQIIDLVGQRFGRLLVLELDNDNRGKGTYWWCLCDCGMRKSIPSKSLREGKTHSCGCLNKEQVTALGKSNMKDLSGLRFGRLLVISPTEKRKQNCVIWCCRCDCGNFYEVSSSLLQSGHVSSCGCLGRSKGESRIEELLQLANQTYEREKSFEDCRSSAGVLYRFDFYVNNKYLIEFDGEQHYRASSGWNTEEHFQVVQQRDREKESWCIKHGMTLIRIPYHHLSKLTIDDLMLETSNFIIIKEGVQIC